MRERKAKKKQVGPADASDLSADEEACAPRSPLAGGSGGTQPAGNRERHAPRAQPERGRDLYGARPASIHRRVEFVHPNQPSVHRRVEVVHPDQAPAAGAHRRVELVRSDQPPTADADRAALPSAADRPFTARDRDEWITTMTDLVARTRQRIEEVCAEGARTYERITEHAEPQLGFGAIIMGTWNRLYSLARDAYEESEAALRRFPGPEGSLRALRDDLYLYRCGARRLSNEIAAVRSDHAYLHHMGNPTTSDWVAAFNSIMLLPSARHAAGPPVAAVPIAQPTQADQPHDLPPHLTRAPGTQGRAEQPPELLAQQAQVSTMREQSARDQAQLAAQTAQLSAMLEQAARDQASLSDMREQVSAMREQAARDEASLSDMREQDSAGTAVRRPHPAG